MKGISRVGLNATHLRENKLRLNNSCSKLQKNLQ